MSIWHRTVTLDELNAESANTMLSHLQIVFTDLGEDYLRATMPVDRRTRQPYGLLHGGASVVLAETLGSTGATLCVDPAAYRCVGQEINATHVRAVRDGLVTGTARAVHVGRRTQVWCIDIVDAANLLVCISRLTVAVVSTARLG